MPPNEALPAEEIPDEREEAAPRRRQVMAAPTREYQSRPKVVQSLSCPGAPGDPGKEAIDPLNSPLTGPNISGGQGGFDKVWRRSRHEFRAKRGKSLCSVGKRRVRTARCSGRFPPSTEGGTGGGMHKVWAAEPPRVPSEATELEENQIIKKAGGRFPLKIAAGVEQKTKGVG